MLKKILCTLAMPAALTFVYAVPARADVPPWPVNQLAYIPDGVFNTLDEAGCRACHEDPGVVNPGTIPNRHHLLVENPAETINCDYTAAIFADCPTANNKMYECYDCHNLVWNDATSSNEFATFRDCLFCHEQQAGQASVHHLTQAAQTSNCKKCHAPIENPWAWEDAQVPPVPRHYIPTYAASMVTPDKALGTGKDDPVTPTGHVGRGGCAFCHGPVMGDPPLEDTVTGIDVYSNGATHHTIGVTTGPFGPLTPAETRPTCLMCHNILDSPYINIRGCQQCHSVKTLHNIQPVDSNGGGIVLGQELAYYGHIGANADCNGCHLNAATSSAAAPYSGAVIPDVSGISIYTITAGVETLITVTGSAFTNTVQGPTSPIVLTSNVVLTAADGTKTTLTPSYITETLMDVTIPATMAPGNYALSAVKGNTASSSVNLSIMPEVKITSASCLNGIVSITGSGFSQYVNATGSGTSVSLLDAVVDCSVLSWSDTAIDAQCGECDPAINVNSVFGEASGAVSVKKTIIKKPVRR